MIQNVIGDTSYVDIVAPGVPTSYMVRSIDLYDLEGPTSNTITEKASFPPPDLTKIIKHTQFRFFQVLKKVSYLDPSRFS